MLQSRSAVIAGLLWIATGASVFAQPLHATPQPPADPLAAARRISATEARQALAKGEAVLVDVRPKEAYDSGHAQGAISLPLSELAAGGARSAGERIQERRMPPRRAECLAAGPRRDGDPPVGRF